MPISTYKTRCDIRSSANFANLFFKFIAYRFSLYTMIASNNEIADSSI